MVKSLISVRTLLRPYTKSTIINKNYKGESNAVPTGLHIVKKNLIDSFPACNKITHSLEEMRNKINQ